LEPWQCDRGVAEVFQVAVVWVGAESLLCLWTNLALDGGGSGRRQSLSPERNTRVLGRCCWDCRSLRARLFDVMNIWSCTTARVLVCPHHDPCAQGRAQARGQKSQWWLLVSETLYVHVVVSLMQTLWLLSIKMHSSVMTGAHWCVYINTFPSGLQL